MCVGSLDRQLDHRTGCKTLPNAAGTRMLNSCPSHRSYILRGHDNNDANGSESGHLIIPCPAHSNSNIPHSHTSSITRPVLAPEIRIPRLLLPYKSPIYAMEHSTELLVEETTSQLIRPRGEFVGIIILRAVILSGIFLVIPVVALYLIIGAPLQASIQTLTFTDRLGQPLPDIDDSVYAQKNATIAITGGNDFAVNVTVFATVLNKDSSNNVAIACPSVVASDEWAPRGCVQCPIALCPVSWNQTINITASFTFSPQNPPPLIYIMPGQGDVSDLLAFTNPIPVPLGSQLLAVMTWTSREIIPSVSSLLLAPFNSLRLVQHMELYTLLNANYLEKTTPFLSTVVIMQRQTEPTKWVQESAATPAGRNIHSVFVLFFGANVVYFAFGRRPLTALGILHFFQSHSLLKKWHEDFPNLYDEGGHPGDTSAGVVAFIREHLMDFNTVEVQDKKDVISDDIEAQKQHARQQCLPRGPAQLHSPHAS
ncbi:hypothetical protein B0H14DRAFT_3548388 [Mycena olivaceomarginata]|nr:hypothetical protein B0H14DRAFT_3548388 [Mycena olivaceomarginata]